MVKSAAILAAAVLLFAGCGKEPADDAPAADGAEVVEFLRKYPPSTGGGLSAPARTVVRDPVIWADLWARANAHIAPVPKAPAVDFTKEMVALAALGERRTAGFSVEIVGARKEGGRLVLLVAEREPAKDAVVAAATTAPWHAVVLAKGDLPVEWRKYEAPR